MGARKNIYLAKVRNSARILLELYAEIIMLKDQYFAEEYNPGGANQFVVGDLSEFDNLTVDEVTDMLTVLNNFLKLMDNKLPTVGTYKEYCQVIANETDELRKFT
jgi:hypothetical protein